MKFKKGMTPWNKGIKATQEHRYKLSKAHLGKHVSEETRMKIGKASLGRHNLGWKQTQEAKQRISLATKGSKNPFYGKTHSEETKKKLSDNHKGKIHSGSFKQGHKFEKEILEKMSASHKGKVFSEATRRKMSLSQMGKHKQPRKKGKDNPRWKGGFENKLWHNRQRRIKKLGNGGSHSLGEWENLKAQYNWTCPHCIKQEPEIKLSVDHIIPISKGGSDNIENIQPLCRSCNCKKGNRTNV